LDQVPRRELQLQLDNLVTCIESLQTLLDLVRLLRDRVSKKLENLVEVSVAHWLKEYDWLPPLRPTRRHHIYIPFSLIVEDTADAADEITDPMPSKPPMSGLKGVATIAPTANKVARTWSIFLSHCHILSFKFLSPFRTVSSVPTSSVSFSHIRPTWSDTSAECICISLAVRWISGAGSRTPSVSAL
jgi:hypothetical protein